MGRTPVTPAQKEPETDDAVIPGADAPEVTPEAPQPKDEKPLDAQIADLEKRILDIDNAWCVDHAINDQEYMNLKGPVYAKYQELVKKRIFEKAAEGL